MFWAADLSQKVDRPRDRSLAIRKFRGGIAARRPYLKVRVCPAVVRPHTDIVFAIALFRLIALIAINLMGDGLRDRSTRRCGGADKARIIASTGTPSPSGC